MNRSLGAQRTGWLWLALACGLPFGCADRKADALKQVQRLTQELDQQTTKTGVYVRAKDVDIKEKDPWGTPIQVRYSQGGVAEIVRVRSAGPDREFNTPDDVAAQAMSANFKGIGEGVKEHAGETASNVAKGLVKGTVQGLKESLPFPKKGGDATDTAEAAAAAADGKSGEKE